jgi:hypothetical protein
VPGADRDSHHVYHPASSKDEMHFQKFCLSAIFVLKLFYVKKLFMGYLLARGEGGRGDSSSGS